MGWCWCRVVVDPDLWTVNTMETWIDPIKQTRAYVIECCFISLTPGPDYIPFLYFYYLIKYEHLNMSNTKLVTNQQDFKIVDLHFVKSE